MQKIYIRINKNRKKMITIEPFIKIPIQYEMVLKQGKHCPKNHTNNKNEFTFCPVCGEKLLVLKVQQSKPILIADIIGNENFISFFDEDFMFINSNIKNDFHIKPNSCKEITSNIIDSCILKFKELHKKDIELLENKIGSPVTVLFGVVNDFD